MNDCIIVGGGVIGLLTARELIQAGFNVMLVERGELATESSWAGGGILSPLYPWRQPEAITALARWSQAAYPGIAEDIHHTTGLDPEYIRNGMLYLNESDLDDAERWFNAEARTVERLCEEAIQKQEPAIETGRGALFVPDIAHIRPPRFTSALEAWLRGRGLTIRCHTKVNQVLFENRSVRGVETTDGIFESECVVVTAGAWTAAILQNMQNIPDIVPVRGQMISFPTDGTLLSSIAIEDGFYLIPRKDGLILAGSTVEHAGFNKNTDEKIFTLKDKAYRMLPKLQSVPCAHQWAGLRPGSPEGIPTIAEHPTVQGLYINAGHFRNGLTIAPASARLQADLILGREPIVDPAAYVRFS